MFSAPLLRAPLAGLWTRAIRAWRFHGDRQLLAEMDDRRLLDLGLRRGDLEGGVPFRSPLPRERPSTGFRRRGLLSVREWTWKLYAPAADDPGFRREDDARALRTMGAVLAEPRAWPMAGFAIVRPAGNGALGLASWLWAGLVLHADSMEVSAAGRPCRSRGPVLDVATIGLLHRECAAWRRHVLDAPCPDLPGYLGEDCA